MPENITNGDNIEASVEERLQNLIENLSSYIEYYHGGSVKLISFDGSVAPPFLVRRYDRSCH